MIFCRIYPFLLVDRVEEMQGEKPRCIKNVTHSEPWFTGHFPNGISGVLIIEAIAQPAILVMQNAKLKDEPIIADKIYFMTADMQPGAQVPGDQMRIHVEKFSAAAGPISFADVFMSAMNLPPRVKLWPNQSDD